MVPLSELLDRMPVVPYIRQSWYAVRKPWSLYERRLLDYLFIYVQEGTCLIHADGMDYTFESGEFCLLQPGCLHTLRGVTNTITPFAHMDIFYNPRRKESFPTKPAQTDLSPYAHLLQPRLNDIDGIHVPVRLEPQDPFRFRDQFLRMVELWNRHDPLSHLEAHQLAAELALAVIKKYARPAAHSSPSDESLRWMTAYMHLHLAEPLTVEKLAERARLSPSRFRDVFKAQFGEPPHRYLLLLRLRHAQDLLRTTEHTLSAIAAYCGFADMHHLAKMFKKEIGLAPGQYRKKYEEKPARLRV